MRHLRIGPRLRLVAAAVPVLAFGLVADAPAQRATEQFIPIGSSSAVRPGEEAVIGRITRVDPVGRRIELTGPDGVTQFGVTAATWVWLDRSEYRKGAVSGSFADCQVGRLAEARVTGPDAAREAVWLKIAAEYPQAPLDPTP